jgi:hypothetical protein
MDEPEDDLTLVYMWAYKQAEKKYKDRIEQLEAALKRAAHELDMEGVENNYAIAALGEKKDD